MYTYHCGGWNIGNHCFVFDDEENSVKKTCKNMYTLTLPKDALVMIC